MFPGQPFLITHETRLNNRLHEAHWKPVQRTNDKITIFASRDIYAFYGAESLVNHFHEFLTNNLKKCILIKESAIFIGSEDKRNCIFNFLTKPTKPSFFIRS